MGNSYTNVTLAGPAQGAVVAALDRCRRQAFVTPTRSGVTVVYDRAADEAGDPAELGDLALTLSRDLSCPALAAAVFDDDALLLGLSLSGAQAGEYLSSGGSTLGAGRLARAFGARRRLPLLWLVLASPRLPLFLFESTRHRLLLRALGHPGWAFATGYRYLQRGERPGDLGPGSLVRVGNAEA